MRCQAISKETKKRGWFDISDNGTPLGVSIKCPDNQVYYLVTDQVVKALNIKQQSDHLDAIDQEIKWCRANHGKSGKGKAFEDGFIEGLKQARLLSVALLQAQKKGKANGSRRSQKTRK